MRDLFFGEARRFALRVVYYCDVISKLRAIFNIDAKGVLFMVKISDIYGAYKSVE